MKKLFSPITPYRKGNLRVSGLHSIYFEESGNPRGQPILRLHGGPGSQCSPTHRRFFNPRKYRIILFDQRGCGKSKPAGEIRENTTWKSIEDIEALRRHLGIEKWHVFGSSWGATLALAYAEEHPDRVSALILHAIFLLTRSDVEKTHGSETRQFYPDAWEIYTRHLGKSTSLKSKLSRLVLTGSTKERDRAIRDFQFWDGVRMNLVPNMKPNARRPSRKDVADARVYFHYVKHKAFLRKGMLTQRAKRLKNIPGAILHGRFDMICPPIMSWHLHKAWPEADFHLIEGAGHRIVDAASIDRVIEITEKFSRAPQTPHRLPGHLDRNL